MKYRTTPNAEELNAAIEWLRCNDGEGERAMCEVVADWLDHFATQQVLREKARSDGVPVAAVRRRIADNTSPKGAA